MTDRVPTEHDRRYWIKLCVLFFVLGFSVLTLGYVKHFIPVKLGAWVLITIGCYFGEKSRDSGGWVFWVPSALILLRILSR